LDDSPEYDVALRLGKYNIGDGDCQ
jgi:hypothetical protein